MAETWYERLTGPEASALSGESPATPVNVGSLGLFDAAPMRHPSGELDVGRLRAGIEARLHRVPRTRQRLLAPSSRPVFVDDAHFDLDDHLRHVSLPRPCSDAQLKRLVERVFEKPLERGRPLWELWVVDGLERDRFALVLKIHVCAASSGDPLVGLLDEEPDADVVEPPPAPRPAPGGLALLGDRLRRAAARPAELAGGLPRGVLQGARVASELLAGALGVPAGHAPDPVFDWLTLDASALAGPARGGAARIAKGLREIAEEALTRQLGTTRGTLRVATAGAGSTLGGHALALLDRRPAEGRDLTLVQVAGPAAPRYLLGARLQVLAPLLPMLGERGLSVAVQSLEGRLCLGLWADRRRFPDLAVFGDRLVAAFSARRAASGPEAAGAGTTRHPVVAEA